jgi:hypothetical protein
MIINETGYEGIGMWWGVAAFQCARVHNYLVENCTFSNTIKGKSPDGQGFDFWLQMVTRGGRRGQSYEVITFDKQFIKASRRPMAFFAMVREELITKIVSLFNTEGPWNLKASSPPKSLIKNAI